MAALLSNHSNYLNFRSALIDKPSEPVDPMKIAATNTLQNEAEDKMDVNENHDIEGSERAARFVNYWMTITKSTTITSFTLTSTFASIYCTPYGWKHGACQGQGVVG